MMNKKYVDIRVYKCRLRDRYKQRRQSLDKQAKKQKDEKILEVLLSLPEYYRANTVLTFVSLPQEVDTHGLIRQALADGKRVAVPFCVEGTRDMDFYGIKSLEELVPRTFGVLEPAPGKEKIKDFSGSVCILPGFTFDRDGYRLGYGGGYYDRFLSRKYRNGATIGLCYNDFVHRGLIRGRHDVPCGYLVTDRGFVRI